jgi:AhpD family alkylhydroperoxidase
MTYFDFSRSRKRTHAAAGALELAARSGLDREQRLLVQLRASFLNNCRFCIGMHTDEALKHGHDQTWCDAVRDWGPGADSFTGTDALILGFTTMGTRLADGYDADLQGRVLAEFGETVTGALISQIAAINTWNRISVLSEK